MKKCPVVIHICPVKYQRKNERVVIPAKAGIQVVDFLSENSGFPIETFGNDGAKFYSTRFNRTAVVVILVSFLLFGATDVLFGGGRKKPEPAPEMKVTFPKETSAVDPEHHSNQTDPIEDLIETKQAQIKAWPDAGGDLPLIHLTGDRTGFLVYAVGLERAGRPMLCTGIEFDELLELDRGEVAFKDQTVNVNKPRIREVLSEQCMIRPGDPLVAVGPDWQELVAVRDFVVKRERFPCPNDPPYTLWVSVDGNLPSDPFFYSTDILLPVGFNGYLPASELSAAALTRQMEDALFSEVRFLDEYDVAVYRVGTVNCDHLLHLKKREVSTEDAQLPKEMLFAEKDGGLDLLASEKVDPVKGSGHLEIEGIFDFNGDGALDLLVKGFHQNCPYRLVFRGLDVGFERLDIPMRPCSCL